MENIFQELKENTDYKIYKKQILLRSLALFFILLLPLLVLLFSSYNLNCELIFVIELFILLFVLILGYSMNGLSKPDILTKGKVVEITEQKKKIQYEGRKITVTTHIYIVFDGKKEYSAKCLREYNLGRENIFYPNDEVILFNINNAYYIVPAKITKINIDIK